MGWLRIVFTLLIFLVVTGELKEYVENLCR